VPFSEMVPYSILYWINLIISTIVFIGISGHVSEISGEIVEFMSTKKMMILLLILIGVNFGIQILSF
jgi:hypothetical protein